MAKDWNHRVPHLRRRWATLLVTIALTLPTIGCAGRWRPSPAPQSAPAPGVSPAKTLFSDCLQANRFGHWVYQRTQIQPSADHPAIEYARRVGTERMQEGVLERRRFLPLKRYLQTPDRPVAAETQQPFGKSWGVFFDLGEPMDPLPPELEGGQPVSSSTTIRYFDQSGKLADSGTLTREAQIEGIETVECPAGIFENCLRIRIDLMVRFRWGPYVDWKGYVWLSPKVGEVRRVQRLSGWFWIFWFGSAHEYRLASYKPLETATQPGAPSQRWSHAAMILDRVIPHPQIAGMIVDFADGAAAMTKPAD